MIYTWLKRSNPPTCTCRVTCSISLRLVTAGDLHISEDFFSRLQVMRSVAELAMGKRLENFDYKPCKAATISFLFYFPPTKFDIPNVVLHYFLFLTINTTYIYSNKLHMVEIYELFLIIINKF
jgi:hypothetical protein